MPLNLLNSPIFHKIWNVTCARSWNNYKSKWISKQRFIERHHQNHDDDDDDDDGERGDDCAEENDNGEPMEDDEDEDWDEEAWENALEGDGIAEVV